MVSTIYVTTVRIDLQQFVHTYPPWFFHSARLKDRIDVVIKHSSILWFETYIFNKRFHNFSSITIPKYVNKYLGFGSKSSFKNTPNPDLVLRSFNEFP